jgi:hypothetical protein
MSDPSPSAQDFAFRLTPAKRLNFWQFRHLKINHLMNAAGIHLQVILEFRSIEARPRAVTMEIATGGL